MQYAIHVLTMLVIIALGTIAYVKGLSAAGVALDNRSRRLQARKGFKQVELDHKIPFDEDECRRLCDEDRLNTLKENQPVTRLNELEQSPEIDPFTHISAILDVAEASMRRMLEPRCESSAYELLERAATIGRKSGAPAPLAARYFFLSGHEAGRRFQGSEALPHFREALLILESTDDTACPIYYSASFAAGMLLFDCNQFSEAMPLLHRAYCGYRRARVIDTVSAAQCLERFSEGYVLAEQYDAGISVLEEAKQLYEEEAQRENASPELQTKILNVESSIRDIRKMQLTAHRFRRFTLGFKASCSFC